MCTAMMCGLCGCYGGDEASSADIAETTSATEDTVTSAETESVTEAPEGTKTTAETTSSAETSEISETSEATLGSFTVSPSGYVLDPGVTLGEQEYSYDFAVNKPCFIDETDEGVRVYGVNTDTEREWHYINRVMDQELFSTTRCVVLEHDGIADEFAGAWGERFGTAMSVYSGDFDGDGETEIATCRYDTGGTFCRVMELVIYKLNGEHYEQFIFYPQEFNKENISVDIDNEKRELVFLLNGFDKSFAYDFSEDVPPDKECSVNMIQVNDFTFDCGKINYIISPLVGMGTGTPQTPADICFELDFSDGTFTCSDAEFTGTASYSEDLDGDGEDEILSVSRSIGETRSHVTAAVVHKTENGDHYNYKRYAFDTKAFNDEYINVEIDSEIRSLNISIKGLDKTFVYDLSEIVSPEETGFEVDLTTANSLICDGGEMIYTVTPLIDGYASEAFVEISFKLNFSDGVFTCSDAEFTEK